MTHWNGIDILVNNAGIGVYGDTDRTEVEDFRRLMEVNFFGSVRCILGVLPIMKRAGNGLIINIASVASKHGIPYLAGYCASKAALVALSQSLRAELSSTGISVMIVYPGYTQTDFFKKEKNVGGAHRPAGPYVPVHKVAKSIIKGIEKEKNDLILSATGKALDLFQPLVPKLVEWSMRRIALNLRDKQEA
jgi:short-subunit dehydrogenase